MNPIDQILSILRDRSLTDEITALRILEIVESRYYDGIEEGINRYGLALSEATKRVVDSVVSEDQI